MSSFRMPLSRRALFVLPALAALPALALDAWGYRVFRRAVK